MAIRMMPYYPALRFKQGEYYAGSRIGRDIQGYVQPRFIIPPPKESDPEKGSPLTVDEIAHWTGERIGKHWPLFPAFLDAQYVASILGDSGLSKLFRSAQRYNEKLVPVATVDDLFKPLYRTFKSDGWPKLGVYVPYDDITPDLLRAGLDAVRCSPEDCVVFVDFTGAELSPEIAAGSVRGVFEFLYETAYWGRIIFQGSAFPPTNPAECGGQFFVPRNEWKTFHAAIGENSVPTDRIGYGDFGADCGEISFPKKSGGGRPIPHLRYTTATHILVVRGQETGTNEEAMLDVFNRILESGYFAGRGFSYADNEIWRRAHSLDSCGSASMWREWNMAHHITRVVRDFGAMSGIAFEDRYVNEVPPTQMSMFDTDT